MYKRKTERSVKFTTEVMENVYRSLENGETKRLIPEYLGVPTVGKRLKAGTVPSFKTASKIKNGLIIAKLFGITIVMLSLMTLVTN